MHSCAVARGSLLAQAVQPQAAHFTCDPAHACELVQIYLDQQNPLAPLGDLPEDEEGTGDDEEQRKEGDEQ